MTPIDPLLFQIGTMALSAAFAAGGAYLAVRTEMKYMRRDIDETKQRVTVIEDRLRTDVSVLHGRINDWIAGAP